MNDDFEIAARFREIAYARTGDLSEFSAWSVPRPWLQNAELETELDYRDEREARAELYAEEREAR